MFILEQPLGEAPRSGPSPEKAPDGESRRVALRALVGFFILFVGAASAGLWLYWQAPIIPLIGIEALLLWSCIAVKLQLSYALAHRDEMPPVARGKWYHPVPLIAGAYRHFRLRYAVLWQWLILSAVLVAAVWTVRLHLATAREPNSLPAENLRLGAVVLMATACVIYLYGNFVKALLARHGSEVLTPMLHLSRVVFGGCLVTSVLLFVYISTGYDGCWFGWVLLGLASLLALEPFVRLAGRFYQPAALRKLPPPVGSSLLLDVIFGSGSGARGIMKDIEDLVGMKVGEVWILQFLRETIECVVLVGLLIGWLSSSVTSIPLGSQGVLCSFGRFLEPVLEPGLHVTLPWPFQEIHVVQTDRIRDISLGFAKDLSKPLLWTERHVEGEKNLLIGDGESLLTINVPIQYRVSNPIAYLMTTTDAEFALRSLAERELIQIATARESFHMMTEDRQAIADDLRSRVQAEVDRLGLGLQITFVGLKDIHPPVEVAPAYQNVVSAQEQKEAIIDEARAYEARTLPAAYALANTMKVAAEASYTQRVDLASGEAGRFESIIAPEAANPAVFRLRLRYDALDETLARPAKTIVAIPEQGASEFFLDLRTNSPSRNAGEMLRR